MADDNNQSYRIYAKRWLVLLVLMLLNISGAMVWLTFVTVAYKAIAFYDTGVNTINFLSVVFMLSAVIVGAIATYVLEKYGLKIALLISAWCTCVGACIRIASAIETLPSDGKLALLFIGQIIAAVGQPFSMYAPTKTATVWFPDHQRAFANTCGAVANPIGVVIISLIAPLFVDAASQLDVFSLLITTAAPTAFNALLASFVMTSGKPPLPPTAGGIEKQAVFGSGVKDALKNKNFVILVVTVGGAIGLYASIATLLEQLLCPFGYTDTISGACAAAQTGLGVIGAAIVGIYSDYSKQFSTVIKCSYLVTAIGIITFSIIFHIYIGYYMLVLVGLIGFLSFGIFPIGAELGAESTYPVGVATSSGLIMMSGQIQSILLVSVLGAIGRPMSEQEAIENDSKCHEEQVAEMSTIAATTWVTGANTTEGPTPSPLIIYDLSVSVYICAGYICSLALILIIFFRPKYNRMNAEIGNVADTDIDRSSEVSSYTNDAVSLTTRIVTDKKPKNVKDDITLF